MMTDTDPKQLETLRQYAAGMLCRICTLRPVNCTAYAILQHQLLLLLFERPIIQEADGI
jgi:hypothetical protein